MLSSRKGRWMNTPRVALARDDEGRTLWRVCELDLSSPYASVFVLDGSSIPSRVIIKAFVPGEEQRKSWVFQVEYEGHPMPREWMLWLLFELYGGKFTSSLCLADGYSLIVPESLELLSWDQLDLEVETRGILKQQHRLEKGPHAPTQDEMRHDLGELLTWMNLRVDSIYYGARAIIGEWKIVGASSELSVWIQDVQGGRQITYSIHLKNGLYVSGTSLSEVLQKAGRWVPGASKLRWIEEHTVDPTWLFDPVLLEPYELLRAPLPLRMPWDVFESWAQQNGLSFDPP